MPVLHSIRRFLRKTNGITEKTYLLGEPTDENQGPLNYNYINTAHLRENDDSLDSGHLDQIFSVLIRLFNKDLRYCEVSEQVKQLISNNAMKPNKNDGSFTLSQNWLKKYHKLVDDYLDKHFLNRPKESKECLKEATDLMCNISCLVPVLEPLGILAYVVDSFNCRLFAMLDDLMERCVSVTDAKFLLHWVTQQYFRQDHEADTNKKNVLFKISDPLMLSSWYEKSKQKALGLIQSYISSTLQNILHNEEVDVNSDYNNDEAFNRIHIDVIQCLNETIQSSTAISQTLGNTVHRLCCDELHRFVEKFMNAEKNYLQKIKNKKKIDQDYLLNCFRIVNTCRQLRIYAEVIMDLNNTDSFTILLLTDMEKQAISNVQGCLDNITEKYLRKYFYKDEKYKYKLINTINTIFQQMSQIEEMKEVKQCIVTGAYQSVTRTYLRFLLKKKYKQLKKTWYYVEKRVMRDAETFHSVFKENGYEEHETLLLQISEILSCGEEDSLKLLCTKLITHFPIESELYLAVLLYWRGNLSNRKIKKVLNVSWDVVYDRQNSHIFPMCLSCCICSS